MSASTKLSSSVKALVLPGKGLSRILLRALKYADAVGINSSKLRKILSMLAKEWNC